MKIDKNFKEFFILDLCFDLQHSYFKFTTLLYSNLNDLKRDLKYIVKTIDDLYKINGNVYDKLIEFETFKFNNSDNKHYHENLSRHRKKRYPYSSNGKIVNYNVLKKQLCIIDNCWQQAECGIDDDYLFCPTHSEYGKWWNDEWDSDDYCEEMKMNIE